MKIKLPNSHFLYRKLLLLLMKTLIFLLCTTVFGFSTRTAFSQEKIVISQDQMANINDVFHMIRAQTDYRFIYSKNLFKNTPEIQLKKGEINIDELLKRFIEVADVYINIRADHTITIRKGGEVIDDEPELKPKPQQLQIKGHVSTAKDNTPLPGASILEKGTKNGVTTNFDGDFTINVRNEDAILVISYVGYAKQEIPVKYWRGHSQKENTAV